MRTEHGAVEEMGRGKELPEHGLQLPVGVAEGGRQLGYDSRIGFGVYEVPVNFATDIGADLGGTHLEEQVDHAVVVVVSRIPENCFLPGIVVEAVVADGTAENGAAGIAGERPGGFFNIGLGVVVIGPQREQLVKLAGVIFVGRMLGVIVTVEVDEHRTGEADLAHEGFEIAECVGAQGGSVLVHVGRTIIGRRLGDEMTGPEELHLGA